MAHLITLEDLNTSINSEPRVLDLKLAKALGFKEPRMIRKLIARNVESLKQFGSLHMEQTPPSAKGGRPTTEYWLNKKQGLFLCAKSSTEKAALVTIEMVEVFDEYTQGKLEAVLAAREAQKGSRYGTPPALSNMPAVQQRLPLKHKPIDPKAIHDAVDEVLTVLGHFKLMTQQGHQSKASTKVHNLLLDAARNACSEITKQVIFHC